MKKGSFRTLKAKTKGLTIITAIEKSSNKSTTQSYRYAKTNWSVDRAKNHCSTHNGRFEGARTRKELALDDNAKDYLLVDEITTDIVKEIRLDFLYRTHINLHNEADDENYEQIIKAHAIVADEMLARGMLHHQWDKLDTVYQQ